jgi:hypothetical protein
VTEGGVLHVPFTTPAVFDVTSAKTVTPVVAGAPIVNDADAEVCPPLVTVIEAVPAEPIRLAFTVAVN